MSKTIRYGPPRFAIGRTGDNDFVLLGIDGKQILSRTHFVIGINEAFVFDAIQEIEIGAIEREQNRATLESSDKGSEQVKLT
jgi:hypothetical protein